MNSKDNTSKGIDPEKQLQLLRDQCNGLSPQIYRIYALYLQTLRSILLNSVRNAVLDLITGQHQSYSELSTIDKSRSCQLIVDKLVHRCNSLLTIEHIVDLGKQIDAENKILIENAKEQISSAIEREERNDVGIDAQEIETGDIELGFYPPIENPNQIDRWFISEPIDQDKDINLKHLDNQKLQEHHYQSSDANESSLDKDVNQSRGLVSDAELTKLDIFKSLFSIANKAFESNKSIQKSNEVNEENGKDLLTKENRNQPSNDYLPNTPEALAEWISVFEIALARRLRNLSHALNVELLRAGIVNSIVPVGILDAVLAGQMQSEYSESNLLRISVPAAPSALGEGLDIVCLLIRLSELEFDSPELRSCRSQLKKYQKQILKMVRQQRHWQSRSLVNDLKRSWWQNPPEKSPTNTSKI